MPVAVLAAAFLFNLGQGALRPSLPLYLQRSFAANYRMVTLIPVVFGAGKWITSVPTGYLLGRLGRPLMIWGLLLIALIDLASVMTGTYTVFLGLRALGGVGWAMFATVATTAMVNVPTVQRRGRAVSLLLMSETAGLLLGSAVGGWLYQGLGAASPFLFEAACVFAAAVAVGRWASLGTHCSPVARGSRDWRLLTAILRTPGVLLMGAINATLIAIQTGVLVFLFPLYLTSRGGVGPEAIGLLISLSVLGRLLALWLGGNVSDRWGRMRVLIPGLLSYAALLGTVTFLTHPVVLGVWSLAIGAAAGIVAAIPTAVIGDQVPPPLQGVAIGWLRMMTDSGQILGPLVLGAFADGVDLSAPFLFGAALLTATAWQCRRQASAMSVAVTKERRDS
ncbi:MAG: MFS transporter [Candidatus Rokubacteria bacterium]|nr:MFS transporter [Candidatus Rokubacteria bacterium]